MEHYLIKFKLIDYLRIELNASKDDFVNKLRKNVDDKNMDSFFLTAFEALSSSKKLFVGQVTNNDFVIRKRKRYGVKRYNGMPKATGRFIQNGNILVIDTQISGWSSNMFYYYVFIFIIYILLIGLFAKGFYSIETAFLFKFIVTALCIMIYGVLMFVLPIRSVRKGVSQMKMDLEKEFNDINK